MKETETLSAAALYTASVASRVFLFRVHYTHTYMVLCCRYATRMNGSGERFVSRPEQPGPRFSKYAYTHSQVYAYYSILLCFRDVYHVQLREIARDVYALYTTFAWPGVGIEYLFVLQTVDRERTYTPQRFAAFTTRLRHARRWK